MLPINLQHSFANGKPLYGSCTLQVNFLQDTPLDDNVVLIAYCEYDRNYTIGPLIKKQRIFDHHPIGRS